MNKNYKNIITIIVCVTLVIATIVISEEDKKQDKKNDNSIVASAENNTMDYEQELATADTSYYVEDAKDDYYPQLRFTDESHILDSLSRGQIHALNRKMSEYLILKGISVKEVTVLTDSIKEDHNTISFICDLNSNSQICSVLVAQGSQDFTFSLGEKTSI